jgi:hypothetical protein
MIPGILAANYSHRFGTANSQEGGFYSFSEADRKKRASYAKNWCAKSDNESSFSALANKSGRRMIRY